MKWLFLLLLIINIGIFAWGYQHEQLETQPAIEAGADVGDMRLISELTENEKQEVAESSNEEVVIAKAEQPEVKDTPAAQEKAVQAEVAAPKAEKEKPEVEKAVEKEKQVKPVVAAKEETTTETKKEKETEQQIIASHDELPKQPVQKKPVEKKPGIVSRCGIIGPIKDRQEAKEVMEDLQKSELEAKLQRKIEKEQIGYWVVIPPMEDGSQAQAKIEELAQVGLKDIWHFRGGGMKNAISLGMFSKKENAENFSKEVLQKGFKTEMRPRYLNKTKYLVKFTIEKSKNVTENLWHDVEQKYSKLPFSKQACE